MWYFNDKRPWGLFIAWPGGFDVSSLIDSCNLFEPSFSTLRRRIWKRSFISTVRPTVCTNPSRKRSFSKTFFKLEKRQTLRFSVEGKRFEVYRSFWKTTSRKSCDLPARVFLKRPLIDAFSNFSGVVWRTVVWVFVHYLGSLAFWDNQAQVCGFHVKHCDIFPNTNICKLLGTVHFLW